MIRSVLVNGGRRVGLLWQQGPILNCRELHSRLGKAPEQLLSDVFKCGKFLQQIKVINFETFYWVTLTFDLAFRSAIRSAKPAKVRT